MVVVELQQKLRERERSKPEERGQVEIRTGRRGLIQKSRGQEDYGKYRR